MIKLPYSGLWRIKLQVFNPTDSARVFQLGKKTGTAESGCYGLLNISGWYAVGAEVESDPNGMPIYELSLKDLNTNDGLP